MPRHNKYHNGQSPSNGNLGEFNAINENKPTDAQEEGTDIKQQIYTIWHHKWIVVGSVLVFTLLAGIIAYSTTPIFRTGGTILISESQSKLGSLGGGSDGGNLTGLLSSTYGIGVGSTLANELQVLSSRRLSSQIADTLLDQRVMDNGEQFPIIYRNYPDNTTITSQDTIAMRLRENLSFARVDRDADIIQIAFESPSPFEAKFVVNSTISLYNSLSTRENRTAANSAVNFLEKEKARILNNLRDAEEELRQLMNNSKLVQVDAQTQELIKQIADLETRRQRARAELVAANSAIEEYKAKLDSIKPGLSEKYAEAVGSNLSKLQYAKSELELEKRQLLIRNPSLDNSSPQIQELDRKIGIYKTQIQDLTQNLIDEGDQYLGFLGSGDASIVESVSKMNEKLIELQVKKKQYESEIDVLSAQLEDQEQFFDSLPDNIIELARLKRDVKINESLYIAVSEQNAETKLWQQTQFGLGRVIDRAYLPKKPVKPQKKLYLIFGFVIGAVLSIAFIFIKDSMNNRIDGVEKMRQLKEPLLSVIPQIDDHIHEKNDGKERVEINGKKVSTSLITFLDSISPISESYRRLQNNIIYSNPDKSLKSIMITSSGKGEGKTTTISNLGVVLAEAGYKVVIVDTDLRRPNLHNIFGLKRSLGIVEVLFDDLSLEEATKTTPIPGLSILTSGRRPPNPVAVTQSQSFLKSIKSLEKEFDFVLIDTPPFGIITDASALIRQTDGIVLVARFNKTTEMQISQTLEALYRMNASVLGTALTAFDYNETSDYKFGSNHYKQVYEEYNSYNTSEV